MPQWATAEQALLEAARAECAPFMEEAGLQMRLLEQTNSLEAPSPEPRITIQLLEAGEISSSSAFPPLIGAARGSSRPSSAGISWN